MGIPVLTGAWRKLAFANYVVDKEVLLPLLPHKTEIDKWEGKCYMSLLGFMFMDTRMMGVKVPGHIDFEEVNFRFYVKSKGEKEPRHGIVFINELVSKPLIGSMANISYLQNYKVMPMAYDWTQEKHDLSVMYAFRKGSWNHIKVTAENRREPMPDGGVEEFLHMRHWAFTKVTEKFTTTFPVEHAKWDLYPVKDFDIKVDFGKVFGERFAFMNSLKPESVQLAEGEEVKIFNWWKI